MEKHLTHRITFRLTDDHLTMLDVLQKNVLSEQNHSEIMRAFIEILYQKVSIQTTDIISES